MIAEILSIFVMVIFNQLNHIIVHNQDFYRLPNQELKMETRYWIQEIPRQRCE